MSHGGHESNEPKIETWGQQIRHDLKTYSRDILIAIFLWYALVWPAYAAFNRGQIDPGIHQFFGNGWIYPQIEGANLYTNTGKFLLWVFGSPPGILFWNIGLWAVPVFLLFKVVMLGMRIYETWQTKQPLDQKNKPHTTMPAHGP